jgi:aromatic ring-cleaving dioxygenase
MFGNHFILFIAASSAQVVSGAFFSAASAHISIPTPTQVAMQSRPSLSSVIIVNLINNKLQIINARKASGLNLTPEDDSEEIPHAYTLKERNPYDVHVYYDGQEEQENAMILREKMMLDFPWMRFYPPKGFPIGPHPVPMWEADFGCFENRHKWNDVREFVEKEHDNLSVLIHPHSTDGDYADHTKNSFWLGEVLDLRIQGWSRSSSP